MRIILIRHGDPDYEHDSLTAKGRREAEHLAARAANWHVDDVYVSPHGRARETAQPCLTAWGKQAVVLDWAQEFYFAEAAKEGKLPLVWDFFPADWTVHGENFREAEWLSLPDVAHVKADYERTCRSLDALLSDYGYQRDGRFYRVRAHSDKTIVIFCHFGISMVFLSHLLNISAEALWHGLFLAPTSVTVLNSEERRGDEAYFRAERVGDCYHLIANGEPVSPSGYFTDIFQES